MTTSRFPSNASMRRGACLSLLLALLAMLSGCAFGEIRLGDPFDRKLTLEESQHRYTVLVRWAEFEKAKKFVAEEDRDAFLASIKRLKKARFTEYESESVELDDAKEKATLRVTYRLYLPSTPYEMELGETQNWTRDGLSNQWKVVSVFDDVPKIASN